MTGGTNRQGWMGGIDGWAVLAAAAVAVLMIVAAAQAGAQTYQVIHYFNGAAGGGPAAGLSMDRGGNLYGTASYGGTHGQGLVFKMVKHGSAWTYAPIYNFRGQSDGGGPAARVIFGPDGSLYGTTQYDYNSVYNLKPPPTRPTSVLQEWNHTTLYYNQDSLPANSDVVFDRAGNLYGASIAGGDPGCYEGCGYIYQLARSGGTWTESTIYSFTGTNQGPQPEAVFFDNAGTLYGVTYAGGANNAGSVFTLTPSDSGWTANTIYSFEYSTGVAPQGALISDAVGNFYGTTSAVQNGAGTVFELSPSDGGWTYSVLYTLPEMYRGGSVSSLTMDGAGNLYGTIQGYCLECLGAVYKLTHGSSGWTYAELHQFTNGSDGGHPTGTVLIDNSGNLYGTANLGGTGCQDLGCGVVWEITPN